MRILILGGTKFLGRHLTQIALERHHQVTLFNRGQTNQELFPEVEKLRGNREGDLRVLEGRKWDAVIDTSGFVSAQVRATAELLSHSVPHYTFISSISAYRDFAKPGLDESAALAELLPGATEEQGKADTYGARKVLCEQIAERAMPGRVLNVRPGIIVGPYDDSGRFLYWVRRLAAGGEILAPGNPEALVQLIDVRDLAEWIVRMVESGRVGTYNATGPASTLTFGQMLKQCKIAEDNLASTTWVDDSFLLKNSVAPFSDLPFWLPLETHKGFFAIDCRRAFASGLVCRPLTETAGDTLAWDRAVGGECRVGLKPEKEKDLLLKWKTSPSLAN